MSVKHPPVTTFAPINSPEDLPDSAVMYVVFTHVRPFIARKISIGVLRQAMGGGGGGGPQNIRSLTDADGVDLTDLGHPGTLGFYLIESDFANGGGTVQIAGSPADKVVIFPPEIPNGSRVVIRYADLFGSADNTLGIGLAGEGGGDFVFDIANGDNEPIEGIPYATSIEVVKTALFEGMYRIWDAINGRQPYQGGSFPNPGTLYDVLLSDGQGGSITAGVGLDDLAALPNPPVPENVLFSAGYGAGALQSSGYKAPKQQLALRSASEGSGAGGYMGGSDIRFVVSTSFRLKDTPVGHETIIANMSVTDPTNGGWYLGVNNTGFVFTAGSVDSGLITLPQAGIALFSRHSFADLMSRTFVMTMVVQGSDVRCYVGDVFVGAMWLDGGYQTLITGGFIRTNVHRNASNSQPRQASAAEWCAFYYADATDGLIGYVDSALGADSYAEILMASVVRNEGSYQSLTDNNGLDRGYSMDYGSTFDGTPYTYLSNMVGTAPGEIWISSAKPHTGRRMIPKW